MLIHLACRSRHISIKRTSGRGGSADVYIRNGCIQFQKVPRGFQGQAFQGEVFFHAQWKRLCVKDHVGICVGNVQLAAFLLDDCNGDGRWNGSALPLQT